ncbi:hypothetical protein U1Q18_050344 [Sarracenia purpurea var. burkii]
MCSNFCRDETRGCEERCFFDAFGGLTRCDGRLNHEKWRDREGENGYFGASDGVFSCWNRRENWNGLEIGVMIVDEWGQN